MISSPDSPFSLLEIGVMSTGWAEQHAALRRPFGEEARSRSAISGPLGNVKHDEGVGGARSASPWCDVTESWWLLQPVCKGFSSSVGRPNRAPYF